MLAQCQCGQLSAKVDADAKPIITLCHCTDCQKRTGSPFGVIGYFPKETVAIKGDSRKFERGTYSGNSLTSGFCPSCGSTVYVLLSKDPSRIGIPVGTFADADFPIPHIAVWEQDRHHWIDIPENVKRFERGTDLK